MTDYVMIGNGVSSVATAEAIRKNDKEGKITIVSKEPHLAYSRPLITHLLAGEVDENEILYKEKAFYEENDVEVLLDSEAVKLDLEDKSVFVEDGREIPFDKVLIGTGGSPILPEVEGKDLDGVFTFTEWGDARRIQDYIEEHDVKEVTVVGGGLIGLKTTESLLELGIKVSIVELADRVMSATFDDRASDIIRKRLLEEGCEVHTENTVERIKGEDRVREVELQDGKAMSTDMVVFAIGVSPNLDVVRGTGVDIERGILVDRHMQTNVSDVYAAGDVVEIPDLVAGETRPIAIWPNAYRQGEIAGSNMAGKNNWSICWIQDFPDF